MPSRKRAASAADRRASSGSESMPSRCASASRRASAQVLLKPSGESTTADSRAAWTQRVDVWNVQGFRNGTSVPVELLLGDVRWLLFQRCTDAS